MVVGSVFKRRGCQDAGTGRLAGRGVRCWRWRSWELLVQRGAVVGFGRWAASAVPGRVRIRGGPRGRGWHGSPNRRSWTRVRGRQCGCCTGGWPRVCPSVWKRVGRTGKYLVPYLGPMLLSDVRTSDVQGMLSPRSSDGMRRRGGGRLRRYCNGSIIRPPFGSPPRVRSGLSGRDPRRRLGRLTSLCAERTR